MPLLAPAKSVVSLSTLILFLTLSFLYPPAVFALDDDEYPFSISQLRDERSSLVFNVDLNGDGTVDQDDRQAETKSEILGYLRNYSPHFNDVQEEPWESTGYSTIKAYNIRPKDIPTLGYSTGPNSSQGLSSPEAVCAYYYNFQREANGAEIRNTSVEIRNEYHGPAANCRYDIKRRASSHWDNDELKNVWGLCPSDKPHRFHNLLKLYWSNTP